MVRWRGDDTPFVLPLLQGFTMVLHQGQVPLLQLLVLLLQQIPACNDALEVGTTHVLLRELLQLVALVTSLIAQAIALSPQGRHLVFQVLQNLRCPLGFRCHGFAWFRWLHLRCLGFSLLQTALQRHACASDVLVHHRLEQCQELFPVIEVILGICHHV